MKEAEGHEVPMATRGSWLDARESLLLAPYATFSRESRGRRYSEPAHPYRGPYQRDRDRVVHSAAFRRLSGKMQVFTGEMGDYHRTRLTHTHEVASIARTVARALRLNEDLVEALALLHDIGHPPYGHAGEEALDECLADHGGFSHNAFALTLVESLERRYAAFPGLNLSWEVLEGQRHRIEKTGTPRREVQVVDLADSISYDAADVDDAVKLELVSLDEFGEVPLVAELLGKIRQRYRGVGASLLRRELTRALIDQRVSRLIDDARGQLEEARFSSADAVRDAGFRLAFEEEMQAKIDELEAFLYERVYRHESLVAVRQEAQGRVRALFDYLTAHPERLPAFHRKRVEVVGLERACGEYIAGMTDRFCDRRYREWVAGGSHQMGDDQTSLPSA